MRLEWWYGLPIAMLRVEPALFDVLARLVPGGDESPGAPTPIAAEPVLSDDDDARAGAPGEPTQIAADMLLLPEDE